VGCGTNPTGHVNIDTLQELDEENTVQVKKHRSFIIADGMNLPFRSKAFDLVNCIMTLSRARGTQPSRAQKKGVCH